MYIHEWHCLELLCDLVTMIYRVQFITSASMALSSWRKYSAQIQSIWNTFCREWCLVETAIPLKCEWDRILILSVSAALTRTFVTSVSENVYALPFLHQRLYFFVPSLLKYSCFKKSISFCSRVECLVKIIYTLKVPVMWSLWKDMSKVLRFI